MSAELKPNHFASVATALGSLDRAQWLEWVRRHLPDILAGLAVMGLAWQAAQLTWLLWEAAKPASMTMPVATQPGNALTPSIEPQTIANAHLFGQPGSSGNADPNALPQAQVNLVLAGTMALADPQAGFAIIGDSAANAKFYRVGSSVNGVATLHSVYTDRVVIERSGQLETLLLPRGQASMAAPPVARGITPSVGDNLRRLASNPDTLSNLLRAQPVFANGALKGYRIYPGRDRQQFARFGLQPGDLVVTVNGTPLDDPNRGNEILNTLTSSTNAVVVVERNGLNQQINLDMTQLNVPDATADSANASSSARANLVGTPGFGPPPGRGGQQEAAPHPASTQ